MKVIYLAADAVGSTKALLVTVLEIGHKTTCKPLFVLKNDRPLLSNYRFYLAALKEFIKRCTEAGIFVRGTITDSISDNLPLVKELNLQVTHSCILSAELKLVELIGELAASVKIGNSCFEIDNKSEIFQNWQSTISCPSKFVQREFNALIQAIIKNCQGTAKDEGIALFKQLGDLSTLLTTPVKVTPNVKQQICDLCAILSLLDFVQVKPAAVLFYNILIAMKASVELGSDTMAWSLYHLDQLYKDLDDRNINNFGEECLNLNPDFRMLNAHKDSYNISTGERFYAAPQINLRHGTELANLLDLFESIYNTNGSYTCLFCNFESTDKVIFLSHLRIDHKILHSEFN